MTPLGAAGTQSLGALPERLGTATSRLNALLRRHLAQAEITISQARTLGTLATRGPQRVTELALIEQVAQPTMSALLTRLDEHGLIERRPDPGDHKATLISINKAGLELWRSIVALRTNLFAAGLTLLSASERKSLEAALPALEHLVNQLQGTGTEPHARRLGLADSPPATRRVGGGVRLRHSIHGLGPSRSDTPHHGQAAPRSRSD